MSDEKSREIKVKITSDVDFFARKISCADQRDISGVKNNTEEGEQIPWISYLCLLFVQPYFQPGSPLFAHINILRGPGKNSIFVQASPIATVHKERFTANGKRLLSSAEFPLFRQCKVFLPSENNFFQYFSS